jgi:hypothetical protein
MDMSLHSDTLYWFRANQSLLLFLNAAYLAEKQQIQILAFGLTWSGLEPTIYRTRGEHANNYATAAVLIISYHRGYVAMGYSLSPLFQCKKNSVFELSDMSTRGLLFQWASTIKIQLSVLV